MRSPVRWNMPKPKALLFAFPRIQRIHAFQLSFQLTGTDFTEVAFQADESFTTGPVAAACNVYVVFNLPNGIQVVAQVLVAFEADA